MDDTHIRRSGDDYADSLSNLLPTGPAWTRDPESTQQKVVQGLAEVWGDTVDRRAADLLEIESDVRRTAEILPDWERNFGFPDWCMGDANTLEARRRLIIQRMTLIGSQSREFFISVALWLGYVITIEEFSPIMGGISRGGESRWSAAAPWIRYWWIIHVSGVPIWWFRGGVGEGGKDHHAEWASLLDLECLINRYKPAHTQVIFDYADLSVSQTSPFDTGPSLDFSKPSNSQYVPLL